MKSGEVSTYGLLQSPLLSLRSVLGVCGLVEPQCLGSFLIPPHLQPSPVTRSFSEEGLQEKVLSVQACSFPNIVTTGVL